MSDRRNAKFALTLIDHPLKILVTGATQSIGSLLCQQLCRDHEVHGVSADLAAQQDLGDWSSELIWHHYELYDLPAMIEIFEHGYDIVICIEDAMSDTHVLPVEATANVANLAYSIGVKQLIYINDALAMGGPRKKTITEKDQWPDSPLDSQYALNCYLCEQEVWRAAAEGLPITIISTPIVVDGSKAMEEIKNALQKNRESYPMGSTGVVSLQDLKKMTLQVMRNQDAFGEKYLCIAQNVSLKDIYTYAAAQLGMDAPTKTRSKPSFIKRMLQKLLGKNQESRVIAADLSYDHTKSQEQLGFQYQSIF